MATEKKKPQRSVEDRLKALYELQIILTEVDRIRNIRGELPLEVKDLADTITGLNSRSARFQEEIAALRATRTAEQNKIANKQLLIERYNDQLNNVRNNHEFDSLTKEIVNENLEIELAEKNIRDIEFKVDKLGVEVANIETEIKDQSEILEEKKAMLDTIVSETRNEEENLLVRSKEIEPMVDDERLLNAFKRIRGNARNGLGIVIVDRNACGGCFNRIPPQKQIEIKMHKKVIVCEYCGRIMVDAELADTAMEEVRKDLPSAK